MTELERACLQLAIAGLLFGAALLLRRLTRSSTDAVAARVDFHVFGRAVLARLHTIILPFYAWLMLAMASRIGLALYGPQRILSTAATLTALWIVLRATSLFLPDAVLARLIALVAWIVAALDVLGLLLPAIAALDSLSLDLGTLRLSPVVLIKAAIVSAFLIWAALALARLARDRVRQLTSLSPSLQVLLVKLLRFGLVAIALAVGLGTVGIDLTAFAVLSGAIGVGVGLGLQKIVSNFVSGVILLLDRSIKPGDVIEIGPTFGWITTLNARYVSVRGRDGKEYLIPNEDLITHKVTNWSFSNPLIRVDAEIGVAYDSDLHVVRRLAIEAAGRPKRVLDTPPPVCHVTGFGDRAMTLILRFWINDPVNGVTNIRGEVLLAIWESFRENGIELPLPQREIRIREMPAGLVPPGSKSPTPL